MAMPKTNLPPISLVGAILLIILWLTAKGKIADWLNLFWGNGQ